jgi:hypothetical protein
MNTDNQCMYCLRKRKEVQSLTPIYSWTDGKLEGYFCEEHYGSVKSFNRKQELAYREMIENKKK